MSTILTTENIQNMKTAIKNYQTTCQEYAGQLDQEISNLMGTNFLGDAADGYQDFYNKVKPAVSTNLCAEGESICSMLTEIVSGVEQMIASVDPQIGQQNVSALDGAE